VSILRDNGFGAFILKNQGYATAKNYPEMLPIYTLNYTTNFVISVGLEFKKSVSLHPGN
jgi:hypothetical protein